MIDGIANPAAAGTMVFALVGVGVRFFDDYLRVATASGINQVVNLGSGLDTRGYRFDWPEGTVVFELDLPEIVEYKRQVLAEQGIHRIVDLRYVPIDLSEDWPAALLKAGFDPSRPTAWSAEGLLISLPPATQDLLLKQLTDFSAPGSRFITHANFDTESFQESVGEVTDTEDETLLQKRGYDKKVQMGTVSRCLLYLRIPIG